MIPPAAELVARYLRSSGYSETLASFIREAELPVDTGASSNGPTIEQILQEKQKFDLSVNFEKLGVDETRGWKRPDPSIPNIIDTLPTASNILSVHVLRVSLSASTEPQSCVAVTTADRRLNFIDPQSSTLSLLRTCAGFQDSPLLDLAVLESRYIVAASMSGQLILYDCVTDRVIDQRKDHAKYIVRLATWSDNQSTIIASAGWDSQVFLYQVPFGASNSPKLGEPFAQILLSSIPESICFIQAPDTMRPILLLTRRDSTFLYYYAVPSSEGEAEIEMLGRQNLAPHSNAWVAFTPSDVQVCPTDSSLAAVATSSTPHMKLIIVRLLVPPVSKVAASSLPSPTTSDVNPVSALDSRPPVTQASMARAEWALQEREEAAIGITVTTMASQTAYSTPKLAWRPDGTGIFVNSDDGVVRGFEASTGKLIASLKAHEAGSKVRCLSAGTWGVHSSGDSSDQPPTDYLISGGFDQRLIFWKSL